MSINKQNGMTISKNLVSILTMTSLL